MPSSWLTEDLDISALAIGNIKSKASKIRLANVYGDQYGYPESGYYPDYYDYSRYANYDDYGNYANYNDYSDYSNYCVIHCELKCQVNQFVSHWINKTFSYTDNLDYIYARQYNELIDYLIAAKNYINKAVEDNNLDNSFKITLTVDKVTASDIYYGIDFNELNDNIQKFINGATNISEKTALDDFILQQDMNTLKTIANELKIPNTIPKSYT